MLLLPSLEHSEKFLAVVGREVGEASKFTKVVACLPVYLGARRTDGVVGQVGLPTPHARLLEKDLRLKARRCVTSKAGKRVQLFSSSDQRWTVR